MSSFNKVLFALISALTLYIGIVYKKIPKMGGGASDPLPPTYGPAIWDGGELMGGTETLSYYIFKT